MALLILRSPYNFTIPSVYAEDGVWATRIIYEGALRTALYARLDYPVLGNVMMLQLALWVNDILFGCNITYYPIIVAVIQYAFYCLAALLPMICMRDELPRWMGRALWLSIILLPMGIGQSEILGKILNTGYLFYYIAFSLVYHRVFHWKTLSTAKLAAIDIVLFICCGTHEGCYLLVGLGFFLNVWLETRDMERETPPLERVREWLGRTHNRMWILLGICCCALASFDLFVLAGKPIYQQMGQGGKEIIEFLIREFLYGIVWPVYTELNTGSALLILCAVAAVFIYILAVSSGKQRIGLLCCVFATLLYGVLTLIARGGMLLEGSGQFASTFPDRYYYGCNVMANLTWIYGASCLWKTQKKRKRAIACGLTALLLLPVVLFGEDLAKDDGYIEIVHPVSFSEQIALSKPDKEGQNYTINISPDSWQMTVPKGYILSSVFQ